MHLHPDLLAFVKLYQKSSGSNLPIFFGFSPIFLCYKTYMKNYIQNLKEHEIEQTLLQVADYFHQKSQFYFLWNRIL